MTTTYRQEQKAALLFLLQTGTGDQNQPPVTILTPHPSSTTSVHASPTTGSSDNNNPLPSNNTANPSVHISNTPPTTIISTTTNKDGSITTKEKNGLTITEWSNGDDGSCTSKSATGETLIHKVDGTDTYIDKDGHWYVQFPQNKDGMWSYHYENGTTSTFDFYGKLIRHSR